MKRLKLINIVTHFIILSIIFVVSVQAATAQARSTQTPSVEVAAKEERIKFRIQLTTGEQPISGRLLVFMTNRSKPLSEVAPDFFDLRNTWVSAMEVTNISPNKVLEFDPDRQAFPTPFSSAPTGDYQIMALLDTNHSYSYSGLGSGDIHSQVIAMKAINPALIKPIDVKLNTIVPENTAKDTESIKLVNFDSPALSTFMGRPVTMNTSVALPPSYNKSTDTRYPVAYIVHGFGGTHLGAFYAWPEYYKKMSEGAIPEMIFVFLNGSCPMGHHEFADSVNNGPWGHALVTELIPYLESKFRMDGKPAGRLLNGHSSGGWSTLWLQITYPDFFGGTWSTAPDPVDFRNFTGPDITRTPTQNFYYKTDGSPYNLIRFQDKNLASLVDFARLEEVLGSYGGQMASFEAVFSPRGEDGRPMPLFDRETGNINEKVQHYWQHYNIALILKENWQQLGAKLKGKLHIIVGTADTFHLNESATLLEESLKALGSDAHFEFIEGRTHMDLYQGGLHDRIFLEMYHVARPTK